jgi:hypothetical protein
MIFARFLMGMFFLGFLPMVQAHQVASVELEFQDLGEQWRLVGEMDIAYMLPETRGVPGGLPLSREAVMKYPPEEMARIRVETDATLRKLLRITFADEEVDWKTEFPDFEREPFELPEEAGDIALMSTRIVIAPVAGAGELRVHWAGEQETELIILIEEGENSGVISTLPGGSLVLFKRLDSGRTTPAPKPVMGGWLQLGFHHVMGADHILFILGIFLLAPRWRELVRQSLLFTLAHSITLGLAVFGWVTVPSLWVEHLIALSIAWIGIENLWIRKICRQRLIFVFGFGLLHGLGFASVLKAKLEGVPRDGLLGPLLGFNVGVELAQIGVLGLAWILLWPLRGYLKQVQKYGSILIAVAGLAWLVQRLFFPGAPLF